MTEMRKASIGILLLFPALLHAQPACVRQPQSGLHYTDDAGKKREAAEWACVRGSYTEAWDLLSARGLAPIRPAKVADLGAKVNRLSRKGMLLIGLRFAAYAAPGIPLAVEIHEHWIEALLAGAPALVDGTIKMVEGVPDDFAQTPSDSGYVTIYSAATSLEIVSARDVPARAPLAVPAFVPAYRIAVWDGATPPARPAWLDELAGRSWQAGEYERRMALYEADEAR